MNRPQFKLFIDDAETEALIQQLATERNVTSEEAVMLAVSNELARMDALAAE